MEKLRKAHKIKKEELLSQVNKYRQIINICLYFIKYFVEIYPKLRFLPLLREFYNQRHAKLSLYQ